MNSSIEKIEKIYLVKNLNISLFLIILKYFKIFLE